MNGYPSAVTKIVDDYQARLGAQLRQVPAAEREEFLREISTHLYDAYDRQPGDDEVTRILAVLRNFGEPAEVVAERLPEAMVRAGSRRSLPLLIVGGTLLVLFGLPLGLGGAGVLVGVLAALVAVIFSYYAAAGSIVLSGVVVMVCGLLRMFASGLWDKLVEHGYIQIKGPPAEFLDLLSPFGQGILLLLVGAMLAAAGLAMIWLGRYLLRGLRFFGSLLADWVRRSARALRRNRARENGV